MESQYVQVFLFNGIRCWKKQAIYAQGGGVKFPGVLRNNRQLEPVAGSKKRQMALSQNSNSNQEKPKKFMSLQLLSSFIPQVPK